MPTSRVFFALPPAAEVRAPLAHLAREVAASTGGRASAEDSIHLTLAFVGDVAREREPVLHAIGSRMRGARFELALDRLGGFRHARVAWIAPSAVPRALLDLQHAIVAALMAQDFAVDSRPFTAHVTLARHCRNLPLATAACATPVDWPVREFSLWQSTTAAGGAHYRELARWLLGD
jgi:RNA 2',3'-cyclic 3'-phosphodiesterase